MTIAERLPDLDRSDLLTLQTNARRLHSEAGIRADAAGALLPLIEAELAKREPVVVPKARRTARSPARQKAKA
jgi:hypothetical protein